MERLDSLVVFWSGRGIHFMVLWSFTLQAVLLMLADIRRRKDWIPVKVIIWSAYMMADTTALYALGHMSVVCRLPEHHLMALWAPLLLVHLGGQDNITAYAIEDNSLWLRHLKDFGLQVAGAAYVLHVSSILSGPSNLLWASIFMFVVGLVKCGERVWTLMRADSCASSSLSARSYKDFHTDEQPDGRWWHNIKANSYLYHLAVACRELDVPKQLFEGPSRYVTTTSNSGRPHDGQFILDVIGIQLSMMYDLLYTKAAVVHTWYGLFSRVISLAFTVTALHLFLALSDKDGYSRVDVTVTKVLLIGAVILETTSLLRAVFSKWTAVLLFKSGMKDEDSYSVTNDKTLVDRIVYFGIVLAFTFGHAIYAIEFLGKEIMQLVLTSKRYWSGCMNQHNFFKLCHHAKYSTGSKIAEMIGWEDWWDSMFYSWTTHVPDDIIHKVVQVVGTTKDGQKNITESQGLNALRRYAALREDSGGKLMQLLTTRTEGAGEMMRLEVDESILVWHIATHVYIKWLWMLPNQRPMILNVHGKLNAVQVISNYMFFLLASRPYMLPYPVSRKRYVKLCYDARTLLNAGFHTSSLVRAIDVQREALVEGAPFIPTADMSPEPARRCSINPTLDIACQLAANIIHENIDDHHGTIDMIFEVWVEMLCYTAYWCNENFHAKYLSGGGDIMTVVALLMIYKSHGLF